MMVAFRQAGLLLCLIIGMAATPISARNNDDLFRPIPAKEAITIRPDRAYLVVRLENLTSPAFLRAPPDSASALNDVDALRDNLFFMPAKRPYAMAGETRLMVIEVKPASYVFYGAGSFISSAEGYMRECLCLGTIQFDAAAGKVLDLGTIYFGAAWEPAKVPELASESNLKSTKTHDDGVLAVALRPSRAGDWTPPEIAMLRPQRAAFRAVGPFVENESAEINRLAAIPGVLAYDGGRVIDLASGKEALPR